MKKFTKGQWFDILVSPYLMAFPLAVFAIILLPDMFQKYVVKQTFSGGSNKPNSVEEYHDLDGDGYSEFIVAYANMIGSPAVQVRHNNGILVDQWNFSGKFPASGLRFYCADLNNDSIKEIYVFTYRRDTLFLNAFDPLNGGHFLFKNRYIAKFGTFDGKSDGLVRKVKQIDLNGDGVNELLMVLHGGFSKQPRGLFAYDAVHDTLFRTPVMGAGINDLICTDINKDGKPEIYCSTNTIGNIPDSLGIPYNDYSSWFLGFDEKLHFLFKPVEFNAYTSSCRITNLQSGGKTRIAALFRNNGNPPLFR